MGIKFCTDCAFWDIDKSHKSGKGFCCYLPPVVDKDVEGYVSYLRPETYETDFCSKWMRSDRWWDVTEED